MTKETKVCKGCGKELPISEFYPCKSNKDGLNGLCKKCYIEKRKGKERIAGISKNKLKDYFGAIELSFFKGKENTYSLYDLEDKSPHRMGGRYIGEVAHNPSTGRVTFLGKKYTDCEELKKACIEWADSLPYSSDCFDNTFVNSYQMQAIATEHLERLGFEQKKSRWGYSDTWVLRFSPYDVGGALQITLDSNNVGDKREEVDTIVAIGEWTSRATHKSWEDIVKRIDGLVLSVYLSAMPKMLDVTDKIDLKSIGATSNDVFERINYGTMSIERFALKGLLVAKLEEALKILKEE